MTVIVGTPFDFRLSYGKSLRSETVVQIDMSQNAIGRNRDVDLGLVGNIDTILAALTQAVAGRAWKDPEGRTAWVEHLRELESKQSRPVYRG